MSIHRPLSIGGGWTTAYPALAAYADSASKRLAARHYFDAIMICCVGYDVLVNILPESIRRLNSDKLTPEQQKVIAHILHRRSEPAGNILCKLREAKVLNPKIDKTLKKFNEMRNRVIHPIEHKKGFLSLKQGAIVPPNATKRDAERHYRHFCHIIDLPGGESPRKQEKARRTYPSFTQQVQAAQREEKVN